MKPRKSITLEIQLPQIGGDIEKSSAFKRFLAEAASKLLSQSCNAGWVREKYVQYLKAEEKKRRQAFQRHVADFKAGKATAHVAAPATASEPTANVPTASEQPAASSKKAPVATNGEDGNGNE